MKVMSIYKPWSIQRERLNAALMEIRAYTGGRMNIYMIREIEQGAEIYEPGKHDKRLWTTIIKRGDDMKYRPLLTPSQQANIIGDDYIAALDTIEEVLRNEEKVQTES